MVQSSSWEANWFAASQEIPRISQNPKVHYLTHKHPPPVSILGQPNPVHIPASHLLEIHPNIHLSKPRSPHWSSSLRFPHQDPVHPPFLTYTRHMPSPSHSNRFYHPRLNTPVKKCWYFSYRTREQGDYQTGNENCSTFKNVCSVFQIGTFRRIPLRRPEIQAKSTLVLLQRVFN